MLIKINIPAIINKNETKSAGIANKIEITKRSRARRSKLYYIRTKAVKDVRSKMRSVANVEDDKEVEEKTAE